MIAYTNSLDGITADKLHGFFVGWPNPPTPETHLRILQGSAHFILAIDNETGQVVGFITAISDDISAAYIPHLEVLPDYKHRGIGSGLVQRMLTALKDIYMVDLICDADLQPFYGRFGMRPYTGMIHRNYDRQSGAP